ncbi:unnamed protein product [Cylicocyclus nassatus]|uniref:Uncharacterized protein n=1 Tax=Cylicocyclus nassatus TaxID=53992 RepID=A0AA36DIV9_CYLNA|nr:unnamed protein product [Cylicocyclus nassatus]
MRIRTPGGFGRRPYVPPKPAVINAMKGRLDRFPPLPPEKIPPGVALQGEVIIFGEPPPEEGEEIPGEPHELLLCDTSSQPAERKCFMKNFWVPKHFFRFPLVLSIKERAVARQHKHFCRLRSLSMLLEFAALVVLTYSTFGQGSPSAVPPPPPPPTMLDGPFGPGMGPAMFPGGRYEEVERRTRWHIMPHGPPMPPGGLLGPPLPLPGLPRPPWYW